MKTIFHRLVKLAAVSLLCISVLSFSLVAGCGSSQSNDSGQDIGSTPITNDINGTQPSQNLGVTMPAGSSSYSFVSPYYTPGLEPDVAFADDGTVVQVHHN